MRINVKMVNNIFYLIGHVTLIIVILVNDNMSTTGTLVNIIYFNKIAIFKYYMKCIFILICKRNNIARICFCSVMLFL